MAVDPHIVYGLSRRFAEAVQTFLRDHAEEWDGGGTGYEAGGLHSMADELLDAMEAVCDERSER